MQHSDKTKAYALAQRALGFSYREIAANIRQTLKESVDHSSVYEWCHNSPEVEQASQNARLQRMLSQDLELGVRFGEMLHDQAEKLDRDQLIRAYGVNRDKTQGWVRIIQDERRQSTLLDHLRQQLRQKTPAELKAIVLHGDHDESLTDDKMTLPSIQVIPPPRPR